MTELEVRPIADGDIGAATRLWHDSGLTRPWNDPVADAVRALAGPASTVLGGFVAGQLLATVMVGHDGHRGWVYYLAVAENQRCNGHGAMMMRAAEGWLIARKLPRVNLMVRHENARAIGFYRRLGYTESAVTILARPLDPL